MTNLLKQRPRVIDQFRDYGEIRRNYAIRSMFITRLSDIIFTLREEGWVIETVNTRNPNECIYKLVSMPKKYQSQ